jgi:hypothetical protein
LHFCCFIPAGKIKVKASISLYVPKTMVFIFKKVGAQKIEEHEYFCSLVKNPSPQSPSLRAGKGE